jgi:cAMP-dependent protein kinase regulator
MRATANNMLFKDLTPEQKQIVFRAMEKVTVRTGETLIREGSAGDYFYVVLAGNFEVFKQETGNVPVYSYTGGGSFGELGEKQIMVFLTIWCV